MPRTSDELTKMVFPVEGTDEDTEKLWVRQVGSGRYRVMNIPLLVFGVSCGDVVSGEMQGSELRFGSVIERGGHSTYRLMLAPDAAGIKFEGYWRRLSGLGCGYESATPRFLAVDVPPQADIYKVYELLEEGQAHGAWRSEEGHCGHALTRAHRRRQVRTLRHRDR